MLYYKKGFISFSYETPIIAHCISKDKICNTGFASRLPKDHKSELDSINIPHFPTFVVTPNFLSGETSSLIIIHLVTKEKSSHEPLRADFNEALNLFSESFLGDVIVESNLVIHCPMIGSDLDNLSWKKTEDLLITLPQKFQVWTNQDFSNFSKKASFLL